MSSDQQKSAPKYTCNEYREEMILLALRQKMRRSDLTDDERKQLAQEIVRLEKAIGF